MAFVLSSLSGNLISAASAGYAPTNSGDVSAIASAYQVVSATATQLNAGTAYLTSVNETPISAARAGNAANAALATSAWYDGTGRFISSLPDEATVSAIASAYADPKLDQSAIECNAESAVTAIGGSAIAAGGASYTSPSGTIIVGADTLEGTDSGVGVTNLTSFQKSGYFGTTYGPSASGSSNYPTVFNLSGSAGTLSLSVSSNGVYYTSIPVEQLNGPVVIPSGSWRIQKDNYAPMYWTAEYYYSGTANIQLAHKSDVAVTSITRGLIYDYSTTPTTTSTAVSAINGEHIQARNALSARTSQYAIYSVDGKPLSAMITATPYSKNGTIHTTGLRVEGSDSAFMPSPYVESGVVTAVPNEWDSSHSAQHWGYSLITDTSDKLTRIDISGGNNYGTVNIVMQNGMGDGILSTSTSFYLNPYNTSTYEIKAPFDVDYITLSVSSQNSASAISSVAFTAYSQDSGTVVPLAHASALPTYGYDGTAITSIDGSAIGGGGGGGIDSATCSAIASAYAESAASGKQDTLTFDWDADSAISSINGSALAGGGGGGGSPIVVTGTAWDPDTSAYVYDLSSNLSAAERHVYSSQLDGQMNYIDKFFDDSSNTYRLEAALIRAGAEQYAGALSSRFVYMPRSSMWTTADDATGVFAPLQYATGACLAMSSTKNFKAYYKGNEWFVADSRYGYARGEVHQSRGCRVIVEHTGGALSVLSAKNSEANVTLNNTAYGTAKMAVAPSQAYVQVQRGNVDSKYNSAKLDTDYLKFYNSMTTGYIDPEDTASGTAYMPAETEYLYISSIPYWNAKLDASAIECDTASAITAIGGSAIAGGGGGVDSATVSAIASSYAESAASSKLDSSASSSFYTTANESGFVGSSYVDSAVSGKMDTFSAGEGLEFVQSGSDQVLQVEAPVDIVAGPGIVIDNPDGNTLRVSVAQDMETVLFESANGVQNNITLSENIENFEFVRVEWCPYTEASNWTTPYDVVITKVNVGLLHLCGYGMSDDTTYQIQTNLLLACSTTSVTVSKCGTITTSPTESKTSALTGYKIFKIVGIHRIANN